ncbi:hypothetical protein EYC58_02265 [Candidatus Saccharibacteria bacterium]|nr:MAG: hypothetical protein EYC58_02265 [Candidatus Saccharibacteria bacterium]
MKKYKNIFSSTQLIAVGMTIVVLSNPLLYLLLAVSIIDMQNLFGASIDRQTVSFNTGDPFIQAMGIVGAVGAVLVVAGLWKRRSER